LLGRFSDTAGFAAATFHEHSYSLSRIAAIAEISESAVVERCLMTRSGAPMPEPDDGFLLASRVRHILSEAARVEASCDALLRLDAAMFGNLMNESHESCRRNYGISTVELDVLSSIMRDAGALGSRLTGAGFGGCAISLVRDTDIDRVIASVKERYYGVYMPGTHPESTEQGLVFAVKPAGCAVSSPLHTSGTP
jgi:galactokinase